MTKRFFLVALIISLVLVNLLTSTAFAMESFVDVPTEHKYYNDVMWAKQRGLVDGFKDGTFRPDEPIKKGELATVFWKLWGKWFTESDAELLRKSKIFNIINLSKKDPLYLPAYYSVFGIGPHFFEKNYVTTTLDYLPVDVEGMFFRKDDYVTEWEFIYGLEGWIAAFGTHGGYSHKSWKETENFLKVNGKEVDKNYSLNLWDFFNTQRDEFEKQYTEGKRYNKAYEAFKGPNKVSKLIPSNEITFIWGVVILQVVGILPEELSDEDIEYDRFVTRGQVLHALKACEEYYASFGFDMNIGQPKVFRDFYTWN